MAIRENRNSPLIVVAGPTGSGKTALGVHLAHEFRGEIVNFDSMQVYQGFDIGTAKPTGTEQAGIPHHLIDTARPSEVFTAGDFARRATQAIREITARGSLPVLVGGTGFYLRALLDGLFEGPGRDEELRARLAGRDQKRPGSLHRLLARLDAEAAARIHAADKHKTMRALEVRLLTGRPMAEAFQQGTAGLEGYRILKLALNPDRGALYERLNARARAMFERGLVEEVRGLLTRYPAESKAFASLGYAQAVRHLSGELTLKEAVTETQIKTRHYAKRQWTWFRADSEIRWLDGFGHEAGVQTRAEQLVRETSGGFQTPSA